MDYLTITKLGPQLANSKVFVRIDTNATLQNGTMSLTPRARAAFETLRCLAELGACVIVGTHNGRRGDLNFVSVAPLFQLLRAQGEDVPSMLCPGNTYDAQAEGLNDETIAMIQKLSAGQILLLENLRFLKWETAKLSPEEFRTKKWVRDLIDRCGVRYAVLDGFSVAHRAQMSVVGLSEIINLAGLTVEKELQGASRVLELLAQNQQGQGQVVFIMGGAKIQDYLSLLTKALATQRVRYILAGGLLGQLALFAAGYDLGPSSQAVLQRRDSAGRSIWDFKEQLAELLQAHPENLCLPQDVAYLVGEQRQEYPVTNIPAAVREQYAVFDIGSRTIEHYQQLLAEASMVYWKGPLGAFDYNPIFGQGSEVLLTRMLANPRIFSVMGGGDTAAMLAHFGVDSKQIGYMSLAGGALIKLLAGEELPGIKVLTESYARFRAQKA